MAEEVRDPLIFFFLSLSFFLCETYVSVCNIIMIVSIKTHDDVITLCEMHGNPLSFSLSHLFFVPQTRGDVRLS